MGTEDGVTFVGEDAAQLRSVLSRINKGLRATSAGAGLTPSALDCLGTVARRGPVRLSDLAALDGLNPTMLSRIAGKLEDARLVARRPRADDGRSFSLEVTAEGQRLHDEVIAERVGTLLAALGELDATSRAAIVSALPALERLAELLRGTRSDAGARATHDLGAATR